jgi:ElaB/YqjD/DUF883 family membrane-anchored ribosome-binding protein
MNNVKEHIEQLQKSFQKMLKANEKILKDLPDESRLKVAPIQADINEIMRAVKKGDLNRINEIREKYADSDTQ